VTVEHQVDENLTKLRTLPGAQFGEALNSGLEEILRSRHCNECCAVANHALGRIK
jgi:hypothetical protein